ncbi:MAG: hypothetical protein RIT27_765 [Pseudomonadota bacterium]|jgi:uncharacterized protein (DUF58 family)
MIILKKILFRNFRWVYLVSGWLRQRLTPAGLLVLGAMTTGAVFGLDTRRTFAYQLFTLGLALLLIGFLGNRFFRISLQITRQMPRYGTVGERLFYTLEIHNPTDKMQIGLQIRDEFQRHLPTFLEFNALSRQKRHHNRFDHYIGYPRWVMLAHKNRGGSNEWQDLPPLPARSKIDVILSFKPLRRGYVDISNVMIARPDPFGLCRAIRRLVSPAKVLILPILYDIPLFNLAGSRKYQIGGVQWAMSVGDSGEFSALRDYRAGDSPRYIHWKSWAKRGKPIIKEFTDEFFVRHALILDTFAKPEQLERFETAVSIAASLVGNLTTQDTLLDLMLIGERSFCTTSGHGVGQATTLLEILACVKPSSHTFDQLYPLVQQHAAAMSGCVCVLLDWDKERQDFVKWLQHLNLPFRALIVGVSTPQDYIYYPTCHFLSLTNLPQQLAILT